jgi:hypothetical protein
VICVVVVVVVDGVVLVLVGARCLVFGCGARCSVFSVLCSTFGFGCDSSSAA